MEEARFTGVPEPQRLRANLRVSVPLDSKFAVFFMPYRAGIIGVTMLFEHRLLSAIAFAMHYGSDLLYDRFLPLTRAPDRICHASAMSSLFITNRTADALRLRSLLRRSSAFKLLPLSFEVLIYLKATHFRLI